jgi:hypothetical protein
LGLALTEAETEIDGTLDSEIDEEGDDDWVEVLEGLGDGEATGVDDGDCTLGTVTQ